MSINIYIHVCTKSLSHNVIIKLDRIYQFDLTDNSADKKEQKYFDKHF